MTLRQITPPSLMPVTVEETKAYIKIEDDTLAVDEMIERMIKSATTAIENYCCISVMPQTWELRSTSLDSSVELARPPLASITSIKGVLNGVSTTVETSVYTADTVYNMASLNTGMTWPAADYYLVRYLAGYTLATVPPAISQAVLDMVAYKYENLSQQSIPPSLFDPVESYKVYMI
jgi:uncharacterized phiE125 gp8 family phage protein